MTAAGTRARPWLWAGLFLLSMGLISVARIFELIEPPAIWILFALAMGLVIPMAREGRRRQEQSGATSPAMRRYNRRVFTFMGIYMLAMISSANLQDSLGEPSRWSWLLALLVILPLLGTIWTMFRYYHEEDDEYLRQRAIQGALFGLVLVLVLGTSWGMLEMFGVVPHVWNWWVFPVWALGLGLANCWPSQRCEGADE